MYAIEVETVVPVTMPIEGTRPEYETRKLGYVPSIRNWRVTPDVAYALKFSTHGDAACWIEDHRDEYAGRLRVLAVAEPAMA